MFIRLTNRVSHTQYMGIKLFLDPHCFLLFRVILMVVVDCFVSGL